MTERQEEPRGISGGAALLFASFAAVGGAALTAVSLEHLDDGEEVRCLGKELDRARTVGDLEDAFGTCFPESRFGEAREAIGKVVELEEAADKEAEENLRLRTEERDQAFQDLDGSVVGYHQQLSLVVQSVCPHVNPGRQAEVAHGVCGSMSMEFDTYENPGEAIE